MQKILKVTPSGIVTADGAEHKVDALVLATGFDTSFPPRFPLIGRNAKDLRKEWAEVPKGYFGLAASGFPNYFIFMGPACPIGKDSLHLVNMTSILANFSLLRPWKLDPYDGM